MNSSKSKPFCLCFLPLLIFTFFIIAGGPVRAQEPVAVPPSPPPLAYEAAEFDRETGALVFPADYRLDIGSVGSVEVGLTIPDFEGAFFPQIVTLLAHEGGDEAAFRVQIGARGTRIGLYDGARGSSLPYDFREGGFYQIGMVFRGDHTEVYVNGRRVGRLSRSAGPGRGMPLYVGGQADGRNAFRGKIHYVRLWDLELVAEDFLKMETIFGRPAEDDPLSRYLVAYSQFTNRAKTLEYIQPVFADLEMSVTRERGVRDGEPYMLIVPPDSRPTEISVVGTDRINTLLMTVENDRGESHTVRVAGSGDAVTFAPVPCSPQPCRAVGPVSTSWNSLVLPKEQIVGVDGSYDDFLRNLTFHFSTGRSVKMGAAEDAANTFSLKVPEGGFFTGFAGRVAEQINSIALAYDVPRPALDVSGRWVLSRDLPTRKQDSLSFRRQVGGDLHGNYTTPDVWSITLRGNGRVILISNGQGEALSFILLEDGRYHGNHRTTLSFVDQDTISVAGLTFTRVQPYPTIEEEDGSFSAFGGTFDLDLQVPFTTHIFHGHDISYIDPLNMQDSVPLRKPVFKAPDPRSRDFYPAYQKIVPFGLLHFADIRERERSRTSGVTTAHDYNSDMSHNVGVSIGVPKVFSFGRNSSVAEQRETQSRTQNQFSVTQDVRTERALVVDRRHIELDPGFEDRILHMARRAKLERDVDYDSFIAEFGTHYPHAMTVGTVSTRQLQFSLSFFEEMYDKQKSVEYSAKAASKNVKLGLKAGHSSGLGQSFEKEVNDQTEALDAVGSELSPVPVFLDLRPLSDLLTVPFFDDAIIQTELREGLKAAIDEYVQDVPGRQLKPEDIYEPYFFMLEFEKVDYFLDPSTPSVSEDPVRFYGRLVTVMPDRKVEALDQILLPSAVSVQRTYRPRAGFGSKRIMMTATEICESTRNITAGGDMSLDYSDDGSATLSLTNNLVQFPLLELSSKKLRKEALSIDPNLSGDTVRLTIAAWRLPDMDGRYKDMPICK